MNNFKMPLDFFYGWDLLYKTIEGDVNKKDDLLIALVHFILTKYCQFKCIGIGDDKTLSEDEEDSGSELLPNNWNYDVNNYALRYRHKKQLYILLGLKTEDTLIISLLDVQSRKASSIGLDPEELVKYTKGFLKVMVPTASELADRYRKELLEPVFAGTSKTATTQTTEEFTSSSDRGFGILRNGQELGFGPQNPPPEFPPFGFPVGRGDLDPLGRGGPGNLFPFPSHPNIRLDPNNSGFGSVPRPRFDPFGPPDRSIRSDPNPDHMRPPGFGDDYYM